MNLFVSLRLFQNVIEYTSPVVRLPIEKVSGGGYRVMLICDVVLVQTNKQKLTFICAQITICYI